MSSLVGVVEVNCKDEPVAETAVEHDDPTQLEEPFFLICLDATGMIANREQGQRGESA